MAEIAIDPEDLRAAAIDVSAAADVLGHAFNGRAGDPTVPGHTAWSTSALLGSASSAWGPYMGQLSGSVQASADALRAMADSFVAAEWRATTTQRRGGGAFEE